MHVLIPVNESKDVLTKQPRHSGLSIQCGLRADSETTFDLIYVNDCQETDSQFKLREML